MTSYPLFDKSIFQILLTELGPDDVAELLEVFMADTSAKLEALAARYADRPTTRREAHAIKSSAGTFGFAELSGLARELERGAETVSEEQLREFVGALRRSFDATAAFARTKLANVSLETI